MLIKPILLTFACTAMILAQSEEPQSLGRSSRAFQGQTRTLLEKTAERMPEANYSFQPTPDVRSFGAIIGHLADSEYYFCSAASGEKPPAGDIEKTKKTKAELTAALKEAFAYCDKVYATVSDKTLTEIIKVGNNERPRGTLLMFNTMHAWEHYGNLVTYLRLKGLVPPSSDPKP